MLYFPPEAAEQSDAALANEPEGSGKTYQLSVTGPLLDEPDYLLATPRSGWPAVLRLFPQRSSLSSSAPGRDPRLRVLSTRDSG